MRVCAFLKGAASYRLHLTVWLLSFHYKAGNFLIDARPLHTWFLMFSEFKSDFFLFLIWSHSSFFLPTIRNLHQKAKAIHVPASAANLAHAVWKQKHRSVIKLTAASEDGQKRSWGVFSDSLPSNVANISWPAQVNSWRFPAGFCLQIQHAWSNRGFSFQSGMNKLDGAHVLIYSQTSNSLVLLLALTHGVCSIQSLL